MSLRSRKAAIVSERAESEHPNPSLAEPSLSDPPYREQQHKRLSIRFESARTLIRLTATRTHISTSVSNLTFLANLGLRTGVHCCHHDQLPTVSRPPVNVRSRKSARK